jgi:hypothetical protein
MNKAAVVLAGSLAVLAGRDAAVASVAPISWSDITTGAAAGYCLTNHPYRTIHAGPFTPDGFEIVSYPGVVGCARRNFVRERSLSTPPAPTDPDEGALNSCQAACKQWGLPGFPFRGVPLRQKLADGSVITSGLGDLAAMATFDFDFYLRTQVVAGMYSRGNTWHESDVAQADFCCCQLVP